MLNNNNLTIHGDSNLFNRMVLAIKIFMYFGGIFEKQSFYHIAMASALATSAIVIAPQHMLHRYSPM